MGTRSAREEASGPDVPGRGRRAIAARATPHRRAGCAAGKIQGLMPGTTLGWSTAATTAAAIGPAVVGGYAVTGGIGLGAG